jgi:hypothetical protein
MEFEIGKPSPGAKKVNLYITPSEEGGDFTGKTTWGDEVNSELIYVPGVAIALARRVVRGDQKAVARLIEDGERLGSFAIKKSAQFILKLPGTGPILPDPRLVKGEIMESAPYAGPSQQEQVA